MVDMPPSVAAQFRILLKELGPQSAEVARAKRQLDGIKKRISNTYPVARAAIIGSHVKGTALKFYSDVDILLVLRRDAIRRGEGFISSGTLLKNIRDELRGRYPTTEIRRDAQAIAVRFGRGEHGVDVVPAIFGTPSKTSHPVYIIPDGNGGWLNTSPDGQLQALKAADEKAGGKLSALIRLTKWWMFSRTRWIPLDSTHLEAVVLKMGVRRLESYASLVSKVFVTLHGRAGSSIRDPIGISGLLPIASTEAQRQEVLAAVRYAADHSLRAVEAEEDGNYGEAIRQWKIVYNQSFPG